LLDLKSYMLPPDPVQQGQDLNEAPEIQYPPNFKLRIFIFILSGICTLFAVNLSLILVPVWMGRIFLSFVFSTKISDMYTFILGLYLMWGTLYTIRLFITSFVFPTIQTRASNITNVILKWAIALTFWLAIIPALIGIALELTVLLPIRCPHDESPYFLNFHSWALGLLILKCWCRMVPLDYLPNKWLPVFEKIKNNGIMGIDLTQIFQELLIPILNPLLLFLTIPYVLTQGVLPLFNVSLLVESICYRYIYFSIFLYYTLWRTVTLIASWYSKFKQSIIDEKFLVGLKLQNFENQSNGNSNSLQTTS